MYCSLHGCGKRFLIESWPDRWLFCNIFYLSSWSPLTLFSTINIFFPSLFVFQSVSHNLWSTFLSIWQSFSSVPSHLLLSISPFCPVIVGLPPSTLISGSHLSQFLPYPQVWIFQSEKNWRRFQLKVIHEARGCGSASKTSFNSAFCGLAPSCMKQWLVSWI